MTVESRQERMERERNERLKAVKARRRKEAVTKALTYSGVGVGVVLAFVALVLLSALIFKVFAWNLGVVGLAAAAGATVSKISYGTAIGATLLIGFISRIFNSAPTNSVNLKRG